MGAFDAGVDVLIRGMSDGTKSMKDVLKETLEAVKASILESFMQGLIQSVKKNFFDMIQKVLPGSGLFDSIQSTEERLITATITNTNAINSNTMARGYQPGIGAIPGLPAGGGFDLGGLLGGIGDIFGSGSSNLFDSSSFGSQGLDTMYSALPDVGGSFFDSFDIGSILSSVGGLFFADGGVVNKPTLAMAGEGPTNEAFVPLPDNRSIPVDLNGSEESSESTIVIEQSFDFRGSEVGAEQRLRREANNIKKETFEAVFAAINKGGKFAKISGRR